MTVHISHTTGVPLTILQLFIELEMRIDCKSGPTITKGVFQFHF